MGFYNVVGRIVVWSGLFGLLSLIPVSCYFGYQYAAEQAEGMGELKVEEAIYVPRDAIFATKCRDKNNNHYLIRIRHQKDILVEKGFVITVRKSYWDWIDDKYTLVDVKTCPCSNCQCPQDCKCGDYCSCNKGVECPGKR